MRAERFHKIFQNSKYLLSILKLINFYIKASAKQRDGFNPAYYLIIQWESSEECKSVPTPRRGTSAGSRGGLSYLGHVMRQLIRHRSGLDLEFQSAIDTVYIEVIQPLAHADFLDIVEVLK
ncbi:unnamed protein product [Colias eurytheme]|nr:unnamed protein product [Colias eurytheme]